MPTSSLVLQQTLPTGKYDRLGTRLSDGLGAGAYTTSLAVHSQYYLWMPNGRILRTRLNVAYALSDSVDIADTSVYGTRAGLSRPRRARRRFQRLLGVGVQRHAQLGAGARRVLPARRQYAHPRHDLETVNGEPQRVPFSATLRLGVALRPRARHRVQLHESRSV